MKASDIKAYIIRTDEKFCGRCQSILLNNGEVAYTDGKTWPEYLKESKHPVKLVSESEFDDMLAEYRETLITEPKPISKADWWEKLEVLPPARWRTVGGVELFHMCELNQLDIATWYARIGDDHFQFDDSCRAKHAELAVKVRKVVA